MKTLKTILITLYPLLILLLVLGNLKECTNNNIATDPDDPVIEEPVVENPVVDEPADTSVVRQAERTGSSGELKVTLLWNFQGDIDLHVVQPNGKEIYYDKRRDSGTGGYLDVDNRNGGPDSAENIYWESAKEGVYKVSVVYFGPSRRTEVAEKGVCTVVVFQSGKEPQTYNVEMTTLKEKKDVVSIEVNR